MKKAVSTLHKLNHVLLTAYYNGNLIIYLLYFKENGKTARERFTKSFYKKLIKVP